MKMKLLFSLLAIGLLFGGCVSKRPYGSPGPGHSYASVEYDNQSRSNDRETPNCGSDGKFDTEHSKCIGNKMHDIELTEAQKATFATCRDIKTRTVWKDGKPFQQQKGIGCKRPE